MPDIVIQPLRSPPITRLRPRPLTARQRSNLRIRRRALENELNTLNATLNARRHEYGPLAQEVQQAENHMLDDARRLRYLPHLLRSTSQRSQIEQLVQTDEGQREAEVSRLLHEYQLNRPDNIETIERLRAELYALGDAMYANTHALIAPIQEEIDLAQTNYDIGNTAYRNLDGRLINHSLLTRDLTQARDDLNRQSNDINRALGRGPRMKRQGRPTHKRGKKGKRTRRRRIRRRGL
jgi:chromosome segregation ATPase